MLAYLNFSGELKNVLGGHYLGWGSGANDSANIFGTAVATRIDPYRLATILVAIFVIIGSMVQGPGQFEHIDFSGVPGDSGSPDRGEHK